MLKFSVGAMLVALNLDLSQAAITSETINVSGLAYTIMHHRRHHRHHHPASCQTPPSEGLSRKI